MNKLLEYLITIGIIMFFFAMYISGAFFLVIPFLLTTFIMKLFCKKKINKSEENETNSFYRV